MNRSALTLVLQLAVSAALMALLAQRVSFGDAFAAMARVRPGTIAAAIALALVGYWGRAYRWAVLLRRAGIAMSRTRGYVLTLVGTGYGLVTPGRVGEFARVLHLDRGRGQSLPSVVWDRIADVLLLECMALPAFVAIPQWREQYLGAYLGVVAVSLAGAWLLDHPALLDALVRRLPFLESRTRGWRAQSSGILSSAAFRAGLAGGAFFYLCSYLAAWLLVREVTPEAPPLLLLTLPVIPFLGNLPVAFGGLGLREHVSATVFTQLGVAAAAGPAFSLLWFATATLVPGLVGLLLSPTPWARGDSDAAGAGARP